MELHGQQIAFQWPNKRRIPWLLVGFALMFISAYSIARLFAAIASVSALTGVPQYAREIPRIRVEAGWWEFIAIVLPFLAALMLGFGRASSAASGAELQGSLTYPAESPAEKRTSPFVRYFYRLVVSILGTLGFLLVLLFAGFVLYKLGIHSG